MAKGTISKKHGKTYELMQSEQNQENTLYNKNSIKKDNFERLQNSGHWNDHLHQRAKEETRYVTSRQRAT